MPRLEAIYERSGIQLSFNRNKFNTKMNKNRRFYFFFKLF